MSDALKSTLITGEVFPRETIDSCAPDAIALSSISARMPVRSVNSLSPARREDCTVESLLLYAQFVKLPRTIEDEMHSGRSSYLRVMGNAGIALIAT